MDDTALLGWSHESDSDEDSVPQDHPPSHPSHLNAKYVEGSVGMVRGGKSVPSALRIIAGTRNGVLIMNLSDGGSLYFYKIFKKPMRYIKEHFNETTGNKGQSVISTSMQRQKLQREKSVFLRRQNIRNSIVAESGESIFHREKTHDRNELLDVTDKVKKKIDKVAVYTSTDDFVEPAEMPYLYIPASVPWRFKSVSSLRNNSFQIVVCPLIRWEIHLKLMIV
eukprot:scaffold2425_cov76-Skeletonema_dohrnii-CCMP3373.AAC.27